MCALCSDRVEVCGTRHVIRWMPCDSQGLKLGWSEVGIGVGRRSAREQIWGEGEGN